MTITNTLIECVSIKGGDEQIKRNISREWKKTKNKGKTLEI